MPHPFATALQTGSGKTHTMLGADTTACDPWDENRGLTQRVFEHLFARIQERQADGGEAKYNLRCSFLEIYNENITDLLNPAATSLAVREDLRRGVYVEGLQESEVTCGGCSCPCSVLWVHACSCCVQELRAVRAGAQAYRQVAMGCQTVVADS